MASFLEFAEVSRSGGRRENEDRHGHLLLSEGALFVVADGMGGHRGGALAAGSFVRHVLRLAGDRIPHLAARPVATMRDLVHDAALEMERDVRRKAADLDPRTTCVMVWVTGSLVVSAHVGDSRLYRLERDRVIYRSRDHSVVQRLVEQGSIEPHEQARHPNRNQVYRSIGGMKPPSPTVRKFPSLDPDELLLLCTDGFWQHLRDTDLCGLCRRADLSTAVTEAVDLAVSRAGSGGDNLTVQAVRRRH